MHTNKITPTWTLGFSDNKNAAPSETWDALIPGSVQLDMKNALSLPDYNYGTNVYEYQWMDSKFWHYYTKCKIEDNLTVPFLIFESIEYEYSIKINSVEILHREGMFTPVEIELYQYKGTEIDIEVIVYPAPKADASLKGASAASASCKPPFSYGWDWCPRLITLGICGRAYIEYRPEKYINEFDVTYNLDVSLSSAELNIAYTISDIGCELIFKLYDKRGNKVLEKTITPDLRSDNLTVCLYNPELWWPTGQGEQNMYNAVLSVRAGRNICSKSKQIGFRKVRLVTNEGTWDEDISFPKSRNKVPITIDINNRKIFAKGTNWVPPDIFPSKASYDLCFSLLTLVKNANMNIIRLWGGGYIYDDYFYSICDELGIMVWQEFPLACADYSDGNSYLEVLDRESSSIIKRLRSHPSLTIWCGGNELFNSWSGMTDQALSLRLLNRNCFELDRNTPYMATSPLYGMGHGNYVMMTDEETEFLTTVYNSSFTAYSEFGCAAPCSWDYITGFIPEEEIKEIQRGGSWELHHALNALGDNNWLNPDYIRHYADCSDDVKDICDKGIFVQAVCYKQLFEEMRTHWPYCSMAINWCFNEPWPTAAGNSLINYPDILKPAYYSVKEALRSQKLSVRLSRLVWQPGNSFECELWLLNDSPASVPSGTATLYIENGSSKEAVYTWDYPEAEPIRNMKGPSITFKLPEAENGILRLSIESEGNNNLDDVFTIFVK